MVNDEGVMMVKWWMQLWYNGAVVNAVVVMVEW